MRILNARVDYEVKICFLFLVFLFKNLELSFPFTGVDHVNFIFFMNGQYMEHNAIEVEQNGTSFLLKVDVSGIGYNLESDDEIIAHGKFDS